MLIDAKQTLEILGLTHKRYLNYLHKRKLIERVLLGPRMIRYKKDQVEGLLANVITKGIILTSKPNGK